MEMTQRLQIWDFWIFKNSDLELVKIISFRPRHKHDIIQINVFIYKNIYKTHAHAVHRQH